MIRQQNATVFERYCSFVDRNTVRIKAGKNMRENRCLYSPYCTESAKVNCPHCPLNTESTK